MTKRRTQDVHGGRFYGRLTPDGPLVPTTEVVGEPTVWICRRVGDYAPAPIPAGAAFAVCSRCQADIAFNPARQVTAPKVCLQCAGITPLPILTA